MLYYTFMQVYVIKEHLRANRKANNKAELWPKFKNIPVEFAKNDDFTLRRYSLLFVSLLEHYISSPKSSDKMHFLVDMRCVSFFLFKILDAFGGDILLCWSCKKSQKCTMLQIDCSLWPKPGFGIWNQSQHEVSVSNPASLWW